MDGYRIRSDAGTEYSLQVHEVTEFREDLVRILIEIDLQTFSESTFSRYTAAAFLRNGRVYLLKADEHIIGSCVCMRCWDRPSEAMILSMGIRPGWRGRGLGRHFLMGTMSKLQARGLRAVVVMVGEDNRRALQVYREVGFEATGEGKADPRTGERVLEMRARLRAPYLQPVPGPQDVTASNS